MDRGRAGRRDVDDARVRQGVLKPKARTALLRGGDVAVLALAACGVLHGVALVEDDHSIEVGAQPFRTLLDAGQPLATVVRPYRGIGGEWAAFPERYVPALRENRPRGH